MSAGSPHGRQGDECYLCHFWVLNLILDGSGTIEVNGESVPFRHGCALVVPPDVLVHYRFSAPVTKVWAHFQVRLEAQAVAAPLLTVLGTRLAGFRAGLIDAALRFPDEPERATARVWDLLWSLSSGPIAGRLVRRALTERLLRHLEEQLVAPIHPDALARHFAISTTHLNRLCRQATGLPVGAYVRQRRLERAIHLLRESAQPIVQIAAQVGYPDLSHFNKLVRAYVGRSPSDVRRGLPSRVTPPKSGARVRR